MRRLQQQKYLISQTKIWGKLGTRVCSGPDWIPPEAVSLAAELHPAKVLQALNTVHTNEVSQQMEACKSDLD